MFWEHLMLAKKVGTRHCRVPTALSLLPTVFDYNPNCAILGKDKN